MHVVLVRGDVRGGGVSGGVSGGGIGGSLGCTCPRVARRYLCIPHPTTRQRAHFDRLTTRYYVRLDGDLRRDVDSLLTCHPSEVEEENLYVFLSREGKSLGYLYEE